ncbi:hypothetical protein ML401_36975 (plasmid) [Bradyrhizobium sp. 62B]|uniref:hypothetical protein n=1 Tax=Bradyrhizobium sp. 62B TaxID=2898442 RepID=UPI002557E308|nr:hypothetical protein ML401_36975 [Bradyrhizobium sp. 62B]
MSSGDRLPQLRPLIEQSHCSHETVAARGQRRAVAVSGNGRVTIEIDKRHRRAYDTGALVARRVEQLTAHEHIGRADEARYLAALTQELEEPSKGKLDAYLKPFIRKG